MKLNDNQYGELLFQLWHWIEQDETEWRSVWRFTISVMTLDKIKLNDIISMEKYYFSAYTDTGEDQNE